MTPSLIERLEPVTTGDAGRTAKPMAKGQVPFSELLTIRTAHDVRKLTVCAHCGQIGNRDTMLLGHPYQPATEYFHGRCFAEYHGVDALLDMVAHGRADQLTLGDLGADLMRAVLDRAALTSAKGSA